jgi:phosphoribosylglycinamide formyltransferase-1
MAVLLSGRGSNLHAIMAAIEVKQLNAAISVVICDQIHAPGLAIARAAVIDTSALTVASKSQMESAIADRLAENPPELIVLAGFMRILSVDFVNRWLGRIVNIHPSLLPEFPGLHTHRRVLQAGRKEHGASVHFVTPAVDAGPIIVQAKVPVLENDSESSLAERVLEKEHLIYPMALQWIAEQRIEIINNKAYLDAKLLPIVIR